MAFCTLQFRSPALIKACSMNVIFPDDKEGPFPVFYLLHGLSDDHSIWMRRTSIERYVQDLPIIVVMPDGGRSFYCDAVEGPAYENHIIQDVIAFTDRIFNTLPTREGRVIGGLSMGGYGALKLALKYPNLFCSAVSHSGALGITKVKPKNVRQDMRVEFPQIFGTNPFGGKDCLYKLAETVDKDQLPALRIDCGTEDSLVQANRDYHAHLNQLDIPHEYEEFPGAHTWDYWDVHVQEAITFHRKALNI
ncbi:MAG: esterase family protein [Candidatus Latescibacteria bacterium]|nr:esterase family protein [Candidatus Latescibacterota bacterium]